ncbi:extracellular solute-binding protein [Paenibacillus sp. JTLBN-2024]
MKWIKDQTGVTLNVETPSGKLSDTLNLVMALGQPAGPDVYVEPPRLQQIRRSGALENILDHVDQMPNLKKWMEQYPEEAKAALSADGKMYMFPNQGFGKRTG